MEKELENRILELERKTSLLEQNFKSHGHTGNDGLKISAKNLKGFPVFDAVPTHTAQQGTIVLVDTGSARSLYAMLGGTWYEITLT